MIIEWTCTAGTLEPLAYTRPWLATFWDPLLDWTLKTPVLPTLIISSCNDKIIIVCGTQKGNKLRPGSDADLFMSRTYDN